MEEEGEMLQFYLNIYEDESLINLEKIINKELKKLYTQLIVKRLSLTIDKPNVLVFHPYNKPVKQRITIKIHKNAITEKGHIKYLGVMIDATLTWKVQIEKICNTISRSIVVLYKTKPFVNLKILKTLHYSLIYPRLIYAIEVWGSAHTTHMNHIIMLQQRIIRMMSYLDKRQPAFPPADPLFLTLGVLKVHDLFKLKIAKFIYKHNPTNFHSWFILTIQTHNTRSKFIDIESSIISNNLFFPIARTTHYGLKSIKVPKSTQNLEHRTSNNKKQ